MTRKSTSGRKQRAVACYLKNRWLWVSLFAITGLLLVNFLWLDILGNGEKSDDTALSAKSGASGSSDILTSPLFDKTLFSINDPGSPWAIVNKGRQLSSGYRPNDLLVPSVTLRYSSGSEMQMRREAAEALQKLFVAGADANIELMLASGFRSYGLQKNVYNRHVSNLGQIEADRISARPGHSEHQTGWAVDIAPASGKCVIEACFATLAEGSWLVAHAYEHGFIIRYPQGKEALTGYDYEPWHIRYVGMKLALEIAKTGQTLEQYFNLPANLNYPSTAYQLQSGK